MAKEKDDQQSFAKELEDSLEVAEAVVAEDEMDETDDSESSSALDIIVNTPESEKSKRKGRSKALLQSSPIPPFPLSRVSPSPSPASTSGSKKRIVSPSLSPASTSGNKKPCRLLADFEEILGDDFTLHRLTVNPGKDLMKVMKKFNRNYKHRNIYIMSASGTASKVVLDGFPYPLQYEGQLKLLSLSFGVNDDSHESTLLATFSTNNGTVVGGTLVGQFIAATFIQIIAGTSKRTVLKIEIPDISSSTANENINLASEDVGVVPENVSANRNISSAFEDVVAGTDDQTMQQHETDPNNADTDKCGDYLIF